MAIEECNHCIKKVMFGSDGICPNCGGKKNESSSKSRDAILRDEKIDELKDGIEYRTKSSISLILGGGLLFLASAITSLFTLMHGIVIMWWYAGIAAGLAMLGRGYSDLQRKKYLKLELKKLVNRELFQS